MLFAGVGAAKTDKLQKNLIFYCCYELETLRNIYFDKTIFWRNHHTSGQYAFYRFAFCVHTKHKIKIPFLSLSLSLPLSLFLSLPAHGITIGFFQELPIYHLEKNSTGMLISCMFRRGERFSFNSILCCCRFHIFWISDHSKWFFSNSATANWK